MGALTRRSVARGAPRILQAVVIALLFVVEARAQPAPADARTAESEIKAAFISKFGNYVEWPTSGKTAAQTPFVIGALTDDAGARELAKAAAGRTVDGRPIVVRKLARGDRLDDIAILFVARTNSGALAEMLAALKGRPVLTITESDEAIAAGSMVNFVVVDDRVRFDIGLQAAEQSSLKISGRLLALARKISGAPS